MKHILIVCILSCTLPVPTTNADQNLAESISELPVQTRLPELMRLSDGSIVQNLEQWQQRREEIKALLLRYQYGSMPPRPDKVTAVDVQRSEHPSGKGTIESTTLVIESSRQPQPLRMRILVFVPHSARRAGRLPVIIREEGTLNGNAFVPTLLDHDYIFIEYARHDLDPDKKDVVGVAQQAYPEYDWATLSVWAWGGMRVVDYLESRDDVDMKRIGITGHSRGGKMALLAGALDERISLVAPVQSGAGGAGSYTMIGPGGESLSMNDKPHWYADRIRMFVGHADKLPFDQHFLKALVAPRALLCIESVDDDYANPVGTQLTTLAAHPAFRLYGDKVTDRNGLTYRNGGHSFNEHDWQTLLTFAEWHFRGRKPANSAAYQARPYNLPGGWYTPSDRESLKKGVESERVPADNQADIGSTGYVEVGEPGNSHADDYYGMGRFGAVEYSFEIGRRQVTNAEYCQFLNAVLQKPSDNARLYDADMAILRQQQNGTNRFSVSTNKADWAVTHVTWFDAVRYCNWLHNKRPVGPVGPETTEDGAYTLTGLRNVGPRNDQARFALPNDNEWFKAAYYDRKRGYQLYSTNEQGALQVRQYDHSAVSPFGVTGMYDRLWEWNEDRVNGLFRSIRSGAWFVGNNRQAAGRLYSNPDLQLSNIGFRVVRLRR